MCKLFQFNNGNDKLYGTWVSKGYFINSLQGVIFWMLQIYYIDVIPGQ
jgi:hypothetical protein